MTIMKKIIFIILLLSSCSYDKTIYTDNQIHEFNIDDIISEKRNDINFADLFTGFKIIPLEFSDNSIFSKIDELKIINDTIFILDKTSTKSIYLFSKSGEYINKINRIGRGPGEYIDIYDVAIDIVDGSILIFVLSFKKILIYNSKGNFLTSINLPYIFHNICSYSKGLYLFRDYPDRTSKDQYLIYFIDYQGKVLQKALDYKEIFQGDRTSHWFMGGNFYKTDKDVKVHIMYSNCIFSLNQNKICPYIILNSKNHSLSQNDLDLAVKDNRFDLSKLIYNEKLRYIFNYSENDNLAHFKFSVGLKQYKAFYNFNTKEFIFSDKLNDDLTFINPTLYQINQKKFITFINPEKISEFKLNIRERNLGIDDSERERLLNISDYSNPIIIVYDLK
jgi:hypothetical protein